MWMACGILSMLAITKLSAQQAPTTGYAPVNGLRMYYEVHGRGEPVVLRVIVPWRDLSPDVDDSDISCGRYQWRTRSDVPPAAIEQLQALLGV